MPANIPLDDVRAYDYPLPPEQIAHRPAKGRTDSRLMVCQGDARRIEAFTHVETLLGPGDLLVFNDTQVVPCRLSARKSTGGKVEIFVLGPESGAWSDDLAPDGAVSIRAMTRSSKPLKEGTVLAIEGTEARAIVGPKGPRGDREIRIEGSGGLLSMLEAAGKIPLPPYIVRRRRELGEPEEQALDPERYQTVYAKQPGAVAAPTAGLHFSAPLLERLRDKGVDLGFLTLHVGAGTFKPLGEGSIEGQTLHTESYMIGEALEEQVARAKRIVAVGTTSSRALEAQGRLWGERRVAAGAYTTDIFIKPGFEWRLVDALVTNFHLPKSSLLVLVASLMGYGPMMAAYEEAVGTGMRFYSYGDAMWVERRATR